MAITNYERAAQNAEAAFYNDSTISEQNKALVRRFVAGYRVKPARKAIFYKHISPFLRETPNLVFILEKRDAVNKIFRTLEKKYPGRNYYATIINVTKMLARWLNEGQTPRGFLDVKAVKKKELQRQLTRADMVTWEDGERLAAQTPNNQLKAALLTQLDGGFRPSEFISLNYGDIEVKGDVAVARVRDGKTGGRDVMLWRCVPVLLRWLRDHPSKDPDAPLWVMEQADKSHGKHAPTAAGGAFRYQYPALRKRITRLGESAGLQKPLDFYNLRHSSCFLDKMDSLPIDLAAKRHGHSTAYFTDVYGRLDVNDDIKRLKEHYGKEEDKHATQQDSWTCTHCRFVNAPGAGYCDDCGAPYSLAQELNTMKEQLKAFARIVAATSKETDIRDALQAVTK